MTTPVEIIGLVSAVITFVDFAAENIAIAQEISKSGAAATKENAELENRINLLHKQVNNVRQTTKGSPSDTHEVELLNLADEYKDLTIKMLVLLSGLKSTKKRHIVWKSVKNMYKKNEKEGLQRDLKVCLMRIQLQLMQVTRYEFGAHLDRIGDHGAKQMEELRQLRRSTTNLESTMNSWGHIPSLLEQVRLIVHESKTAFDRKAYSKMMDKLQVNGMIDRFDEVDEAHEHTFGWILESEPAPETETAEEAQARQGIINWLCYGDGVFHITGKPGAGKSTLMKYLCQSPKTQDYLSSWAGDKALMTTNFFFWRLGIDVQKSLGGLRRALLYAILQELPRFTETIFPRHWKSVFDEKLVSIHSKDVDAALEALFEQTDFLRSHRLVVFIDGLDEYDGDHDGMIKTLLKWTNGHSHDIKLCVSSREWEIFTQRLADCPGIKLQDITRRDVQTYVNEELSENEDFTQVSLRSPEILKLADIIIEKAEGVFLWVKVTLRSLKWGLLSGESVKKLEERIGALPNELEALYQSIFDSMRNSGHTSQFDKMRAMRTLLTVSRYGIGEEEWLYWPSLFQVPLMFYSFIDEYERDKDFAINLSIVDMEESAQRERIERARRMVYQRCMGLLETYTVPSDDRPRRFWPRTLPVQDASPVAYTASQKTATATTRGAGCDIEDENGANGSVECSSSPTDSFPGSIISGEVNDEYFHAHSRFRDDGKFNHRFMYQPRVRCIHRSVHEFLARPRIEELARLDARDFNESDFHFQAFLACLKMFRPSLYFIRLRLLSLREQLVRVKQCSYLGMQGTRLARLLQQVLKVVKYHHLSPGVNFSGCQDWCEGDSVSSFGELYLPADDALYLVLQRLDICTESQYVSGNEFYRQLSAENGMIQYKDVVLDNYLTGVIGVYSAPGFKKIRRGYCSTIFENLSKFFEAGLSANTRSIQIWSNYPVAKCWYLWLVHSLSCQDPENLFERFVRLFLQYGAGCDVWFLYNTDLFAMWWPGAKVARDIISGKDVLGRTPAWFRSESRIGIFMTSRTEEKGMCKGLAPRLVQRRGAVD
ncbi:hypothetical protein CKAH01_14691 [Colletotrichum kahawae]|uniref:NACHT domain-containing protein n=1 Tax=Colletotrichum kahawae TaxID=34407 RepID=A0AAD9YM49_COLKA|nr:hypothetical protein CKAH01_14691 [Colletotrichum kahawae]